MNTLQNATPALVLLGLMVLAAWLLHRFRRHLPGTPSRTGPELQLLNTLSLGPQQRLVTVQVGQGDASVCLVLGVAPGSITALHEMPMPVTLAQPGRGDEPPSRFAARLAQLTSGRS